MFFTLKKKNSLCYETNVLKKNMIINKRTMFSAAAARLRQGTGLTTILAQPTPATPPVVQTVAPLVFKPRLIAPHVLVDTPLNHLGLPKEGSSFIDDCIEEIRLGTSKVPPNPQATEDFIMALNVACNSPKRSLGDIVKDNLYLRGKFMSDPSAYRTSRLMAPSFNWSHGNSIIKREQFLMSVYYLEKVPNVDYRVTKYFLNNAMIANIFPLHGHAGFGFEECMQAQMHIEQMSELGIEVTLNSPLSPQSGLHYNPTSNQLPDVTNLLKYFGTFLGLSQDYKTTISERRNTGSGNVVSHQPELHNGFSSNDLLANNVPLHVVQKADDARQRILQMDFNLSSTGKELLILRKELDAYFALHGIFLSKAYSYTILPPVQHSKIAQSVVHEVEKDGDMFNLVESVRRVLKNPSFYTTEKLKLTPYYANIAANRTFAIPQTEIISSVLIK